MLGHKLLQLLAAKYEAAGTVRKPAAFYEQYEFPKDTRLIGGVDVTDFEALERVCGRLQPDFVINCVGVIKQLAASNDPLIAIAINALLPHRLAGLCRGIGARLIHISTDCVFAGDKGMYKESDVADATDLYGRTKFLGEVSGDNCLTLRTSIIGRELESGNGLIEWFLRQQRKKIRGFRRVIYTGLTAIAFARVLESVMDASEGLTGVYQVSSDPINKHDLLLLARDAFQVSVRVVPADTPAIDRSLDSTKFRKKMNYTPPPWPDMIQELAADETPYSSWHRQT